MEMKKIASIAEAHNVNVAPHNPMGPLAGAINVHFAAATTNFLILEYIPHDKGKWKQFVKTPWKPMNGVLEIPETPGWGLEIDEEVLAPCFGVCAYNWVLNWRELTHVV